MMLYGRGVFMVEIVGGETPGIVGEFLSWQCDHKVFSIPGIGYSGMGEYVGLFAMSQRPVIQGFFEDRGLQFES